MMSDTPNTPNREGVLRLAETSRVDAMMSRDGRYSTEQETSLIAELNDWALNHHSGGHKTPWTKMAELVGVPYEILRQLVRREYDSAEKPKYLKLIDEFLADERARSGRFDSRRFTSIGVTRPIFGAIQAAIANGTMALIVGPPGSGKTSHAKAFQAERAGVVMIRIDDANRDARGVTRLICGAIKELRPMAGRAHAKRLASIRSYIGNHRNLVLVVDECQRLTSDGLEMIRDVHDAGDPSGARPVPVVLFGDLDFYKLLLRSRDGERTPIKPQVTRRIMPIVDLSNIATQDGGGTRAGVYSVEDIVRILRNDRLRVVDERGIRFLATIANAEGYGSLGFAMRLLDLAFHLFRDRTPLGVSDLMAAMRLSIGPDESESLDEQTGGELMRLAAS